MEWKRSKYSERTKAFLKKAEKWAVQSSDYLVADSIGIQTYLTSAYGKKSTYIPYGCTPSTDYDEGHLQEYQLIAGKYNLLIARMEPENNIETIIQGYLAAGLQEELIVIGNHQNGFGTRLKNTYGHHSHIRWMGAIYNMAVLNSLRHYSHFYFHGHSVGGTNPSLLEAMACQTFIIAHNNEFNKAILGVDALYFSESEDLALLLAKPISPDNGFRKNNLQKIEQHFTPNTITDQYEKLFQECLKTK
jgi:glycosyltransferase involved in cell wall biosynthesis